MIDVWLVLPLWFMAWFGGLGLGYAIRGMAERRKEERAIEEINHILKR